jgi:hypothetical protein
VNTKTALHSPQGIAWSPMVARGQKRLIDIGERG